MNKNVKRFAVMGNPIQHSQSPFIHSEFARQTGIELCYDKLLVPIDEFTNKVESFFSEGGIGLNITVPFKEQAFELARYNISDRARIAKAVNTLWLKNGHIHGCNTDGAGLVNDLTRLGHNPEGKSILLVGAGGASRGAAPSLLDAGCSRLQIANRTEARAAELCQDLKNSLPQYKNILFSSGLKELQNSAWDIVINATSSSLTPNSNLAIQPLYTSNSLAYDMVYSSNPTSFMQNASQQGAANVADGLGMLVGQAAVSFYIWHGIMPSTQPVLELLRSHMSATEQQ